MLTIDLLRHGELVGGVKYRGLVDDPLTHQGREAMNQVWSEVCHDVSSIICSPLSRCALPAHDWAEEREIPCVEDQRIQELSYGDWEGKTAADIEAEYPGMLELWRKNPSEMTPPHGESMQHFSKRIEGFFNELIRKEGHILLVAHSGSIRMLIAHALGAPIVSTRRLSMPYACWSRLEVHGGVAKLCFHARAMQQ